MMDGEVRRARPSRPGSGSAKARNGELSTGTDLRETLPVDESLAPTPDGLWLGTVVPKRHARRSVTRSLLKRQMRSALQQQADTLPAGLYVIRLRAPFDKTNFVSAVSTALRAVAAGELTQLVRDAAERLARR